MNIKLCLIFNFNHSKMNLYKTNLLFAYLYILIAFGVSIVYYLHPKHLNLDMDLYRYQITSVLSDGTVNVDGKKEFDIDTKVVEILIVSMLCITGFFHLFYFTNGFRTGAYTNDIKQGLNRYRWFELSITSAIIIFIISIISGLRDYNTVILGCILIAVMMCFGFYIEKSKKIEDKTVGLVAFCGILASIFALVYNSLILSRNENDEYPNWATGTLIGVGAGFILLCFLTIMCAGGFGKRGFDYPTYDKYYTYLAFILKIYLSSYVTYGILSS